MSKLIVKKMRVEGQKYRRTLNFSNGLNIIAGDIYSGKSLVLRLIDYIFGKDTINLSVQKALDKYCDKVFVEIEINSHVYTIKRNLKRGKNKFYIYYCNLNKIEDFTPKALLKKEFNIFMMEILDLPLSKLIKSKSKSEDKELEMLGIRDVFRFLYIDQHDLGTNNFLKGNDINKNRKNKPMLNVMMNLIKEDKDGVKEEIAKITNEINSNKKVISGLNALVSEFEYDSYGDLLEEKVNIDREIESAKLRKNELIKEIENKEPVTNPIYKKLLIDRNNYIFKLNKLNEELDDKNMELSSRNNLLQSYEIELKEVYATKEINYKLENINHILKCPLCSSNVTMENINHIEDDVIFDLANEIEEKKCTLSNIIDKLETDIKNIERNEQYNLEKIDYINKALKKYTLNSTINMSYVNELEDINSVINYFNEEKRIYQEYIRVNNKIDEKNSENKRKNAKLDELNIKIDSLIQESDMRDKIIGEMNSSYIDILKKLKYNVDESTYIDRNSYIPYYNGASVYEHDSGGVLVCIQIAYIAAIIIATFKNENLGVKYPRLIMLDTIGKYLGAYKSIHTSDDEEIELMDEQAYNDLYKILEHISEICQVIIVDNTPPKSQSKYIKYIFRNKSNSRESISEEGLIDLSKNEIF
jgi:hypothetical protein